MVYYIQHCYFSGLNPQFNSKMKHDVSGTDSASVLRLKYILCLVRLKKLIPGLGNF
jgi:hypothetical protein